MRAVVIDFETFYSTKAGLTLKKLSTPEYLGHPDFRVHCLGAELDGKSKVLWGDKAIAEWLDQWRAYKGGYAFVMHNAYFDAAILKWKYNFVPTRMLDTILIANHVLGSAKDTGKSNSLADLAIRLGLQAKGRLDFMDGIQTPSKQEREMLEAYLRGDLAITREVLNILLPHVSNPDLELWLIDHTLKLYVDRPLTLNYATVDRAEALIAERRKAAMERLQGVMDTEHRPAALQELVTSNKKFEVALADMLKKYGVPLPTKARPITKVERKRFEKLYSLASGDGGTAEQSAIEKFHAYLSKLQMEGAEVSEEGGQITLGDIKRVPALAKKDEDFIRLSFSPYEGVSALVNARLIERSALTNTARLAKMRRVAGGLGVMPVHMVYGGAHTLRWSGGGGFNFLNLANPDREKDPGKKAIAACVRQSFEAPEGYVFISADMSQIEYRVRSWIAGQWDVLDAFKTGEDLYSTFISKVLGEDIHKPTGYEPLVVQDHMRLMRHVGKEGKLGLGYQMAWKKFQGRLREDPDIAQLFYSGKLDEQFCKDVVTKYREDESEVVRCWDDLNKAFHVARTGGISEVGPVRFDKGSPVGSKLPVVRAILPSGHVIYYRDIRQEEREGDSEGRYGNRKEWKHGAGQRIYGGLLLENVTQAISRDMLVESIVRAELDRKLPVRLHVYDSIVCLSPEDDAEESLKWLIESLKTLPDWAGPRLVLGAEGKISKTLVT